MGLNSLGWILYDRGQYEEALTQFRRGLGRHPQSRFFIWAVADTYFRMGLFEKAEVLYEQLLEYIESSAQNDGYNEVICRFKLMKTLFAAREYSNALEACNAILSWSGDALTRQRLKSRLKETKQYRQRCVAALAQPSD
jgi:tetratricopeptide (TPR) repeat protein